MSNETKQCILNSALKVFSENNYHAASMAMIAKEAGVSKGTLYWHFDSKEELFREIVLSGLDYFNQKFINIAEEEISSEEKIYKIINFGVTTLIENSQMGDILRNNVQLVSEDFQKRIEIKHRESVEIFKQIIEQGIKEKSIKKLNPRKTAVMMLTALFTSNSEWLIDQTPDSKQQVEFIYSFLMDGISRKEN
ncbi:TetR/AcrR family transcriptional regulator [Halanaerobium sp. Z-7514]|uniref:TetR/AcrR family transcriptional regulator n=1 Tax=Halanaerobium polyolivorans TaxID=2886943 RepID=A0AAW4WTK4_9FIRM|nr:TetR/AcrR family transcriptional regulator [Halanaerobium polyolivorans]